VNGGRMESAMCIDRVPRLFGVIVPHDDPVCSTRITEKLVCKSYRICGHRIPRLDLDANDGSVGD